MEHQLDDSINLEGSMGVDFASSDVVVSQDICIESENHAQTMPMEFEHMEQQPILMETGSEEILGYMGDQFCLTTDTEYSLQEISEATEHDNEQTIMTSEHMMDIQFEPKSLLNTSDSSTDAELIPLKTVNPSPRPVAIAPKPSTSLVRPIQIAGKQMAIAPKPTSTKPMALKRVTIPIPGASQKSGQTVIAQIGKQIIMMPASANTQRVKILPGPGVTSSMQAQLVTTKSIVNVNAGKKTAAPALPKLVPAGTKFVMANAGAAGAEAPAMLTKLSGGGGGGGGSPRFVTIQPKTIPITVGNKQIIMGTPTKQGLRFTKPKHRVISIQASPTKLTQVSAKDVPKKFVISNPQKTNYVVKTPQKQFLGPDGNVMNTKTQIHQINVPGKGVHYIKLVTSAGAGAGAAAGAGTQKSALQLQAKPAAQNSVPQSGVPQVLKKFVKIAPVSKTGQIMSRAPQSLLAPQTKTEPPSPPRAPSPASPAASPPASPASPPASPAPAFELRDLVELAARGAVKLEADDDDECLDDEAEGEQSPSFDAEHPLIVIPAEYSDAPDSRARPADREEEYSAGGNMYVKLMPDLSNFPAPLSPEDHSGDDHSPEPQEAEPGGELKQRPRKACNCSKSQCLKLYCECFANGEFCNQCNCTNCHNNLASEELRQKAIKGCLGRNPHAFKPKIGKSKTGGPEPIRRHNKGCHCKRSGCLKNYCECYEARIACSAICKCYGCRNVEEALERTRRRSPRASPSAPPPPVRQPCNFITSEVIEAVCQCLVACAGEGEAAARDPVAGVVEEFARCLQDIVSASRHARGGKDEVAGEL